MLSSFVNFFTPGGRRRSGQADVVQKVDVAQQADVLQQDADADVVQDVADEVCC